MSIAAWIWVLRGSGCGWREASIAGCGCCRPVPELDDHAGPPDQAESREPGRDGHLDLDGMPLGTEQRGRRDRCEHRHLLGRRGAVEDQEDDLLARQQPAEVEVEGGAQRVNAVRQLGPPVRYDEFFVTDILVGNTDPRQNRWWSLTLPACDAGCSRHAGPTRCRVRRS